MKTAGLWLYRQVAVCLIGLLTAPFGVAATTPQQEAPPVQQTHAVPAPQVPQQSADPGANKLADAGQPPSLPDSPSPTASQASSGNPQSSSSQAAPQQQGAPSQPMGTAAAPYEPGTGIAASRPAGAAIAPAKQKRTRSFMIRVGLLVGLGIAVGTVVALSSASPSRPSTQ